MAYGVQEKIYLNNCDSHKTDPKMQTMGAQADIKLLLRTVDLYAAMQVHKECSADGPVA